MSVFGSGTAKTAKRRAMKEVSATAAMAICNQHKKLETGRGPHKPNHQRDHKLDFTPAGAAGIDQAQIVNHQTATTRGPIPRGIGCQNRVSTATTDSPIPRGIGRQNRVSGEYLQNNLQNRLQKARMLEWNRCNRGARRQRPPSFKPQRVGCPNRTLARNPQHNDE